VHVDIGKPKAVVFKGIDRFILYVSLFIALFMVIAWLAVRAVPQVEPRYKQAETFLLAVDASVCIKTASSHSIFQLVA
jgi:hypothetical protein